MSQRDSGYTRKDFDLYDTPEWVTLALVRQLPRKLGIWEPAAGQGRMLKVLIDSGATNGIAWASDIQNPDAPHYTSGVIVGGTDFLATQVLPDRHLNAVITNPPYTAATEFIEHALDLMKPVKGMVAMLLRTDFDHAKSRRHLFGDHPAFAKKIVLTNRIQWFEPPPGAKGKSPSENHCWMIWDWSHRGWPIIVYEGKV